MINELKAMLSEHIAPGSGKGNGFSVRVILSILLLWVATGGLFGQSARFFRVAGPVPAKVTAFGGNGFISWTNATTNATFMVQTAQSLAGSSNWVDYLQVPATNGATRQIVDFHPPAGMVFIPAGPFVMGDSLDGDATALPLHTVYVSAFYMDQFAVTKELWAGVYQWGLAHGYAFDNAGYTYGSNHPVVLVSWYDCVKWCNARSEMEGKTPAYYTTSGLNVKYRSGQLMPSVNWNAGYRLATEAEWEKAARGGLNGQRFPWGNTISSDRANYSLVLGDTTTPVNTYAPNGYGLYDMSGNVWQWCWDYWYLPYDGVSQTDPHGPASGLQHVNRGGSFFADAYDCRAADRDYDLPTATEEYVGFRSVLPAGQ